MKKQTLILILLCCSAIVYAQKKPAHRWRSEAGAAAYNFHPAAEAAGRECGGQSDSLPYAGQYTVVAVYHACGDTAERQIWRLDYGGGLFRALTTRSILLDSASIGYGGENRRGPVISTLQQSAPGRAEESGGVLLTVGDTGAAGSPMKLAELMYFDRVLGIDELRREQSRLAVKYGVTLGPVDYLDSRGRTVWSHSENKPYHHRVAGLCVDSAYGLSQLRSRSECEGSMLTISADSLPEGTYLLLGDNDAPVEFAADAATGVEVLLREWKATLRRGEGQPGEVRFAVAADLAGIPGPCDSLVLTVDGEPHFPERVGGGRAAYAGITLPSDTARLGFARGAALWSRGRGAKGPEPAAQPVAAIRQVYPNPTTGAYRIDITGTRAVTVRIYSTLGTLVESFSGTGRSAYTFTGTLPACGSYYVTIATDEGTQTTKLIVK